jgi:glycosyltransferase involved in cell wall biosynthesis
VRVLHWYPNFLAGGAVSNTVLGLAEAQASHGADVVIASAESTASEVYGRLDPQQAYVHSWRPSWSVRGVGAQRRGISHEERRRLVRLAPDVVHVHAEFNLDNFWAPRLFSCPLVLSPHGAFNPVVLTKTRRWAKRAYRWVATHRLYKHVTFHALSPLELGHIEAFVPNARAYCAPQGPGPLVDFREPTAHPIGSTSAVEFITVSRLDVYTKGLDLLLAAFQKTLLARPARATLTVVGPDWNGGRARLEAQAQSLGISDAIRYTGSVPAAAVGGLLANASAYVQASRHEGLSLSVTEALVAGKPTIMTNVNGAAAYDEVASLLQVGVVTPAIDDLSNAMIGFIDDIAVLSAEGLRTRPALLDFFSWSRVAELHLSQYAELRRIVSSSGTKISR